METVLNMTDLLSAHILLKDYEPSRFELNLKMLLSKEAFVKVIKENVTKDNSKECEQCEGKGHVLVKIVNPFTGNVERVICENCNELNYERQIGDEQ